MPRYQVNGHTVEFAQEPSEADIDEAAGQLGAKVKAYQPPENKNFFDRGGMSLTPEQAVQHPYLNAINKTGQDLATVGGNFINQFALNHPRSSLTEHGIDFPQPQTTAAKIAAPAAGVYGAVASPAGKVLGAAGGALKGVRLMAKVVGGAALGAAGGAAYAPSDRPGNIQGRIEQAKSGALLGGALPVVGAGLLKGAEVLKNKISPDIDKMIKTSINTALRPSIAGKKFKSQVTQYEGRSVNAIKDIVQNKDKLGLMDEFGNPSSRVPNDLKESIDSVDNLKKDIWGQVESSAATTGEQGIKINSQDINQKLFTEFNKSKYKLNPTIYKKAAQEMQIFSKAGDMSPTDILSHLKTLNQRLTNYFKTGVYETGKSQDVDAFIARTLNDAMDQAIEGATGTQYKALRQRYTNLKAIEGDLIKRSGVDSRRNPKGFFDLGHVWSDGQIVRGLISLNPGEIASGLAQKGIISWYKNLNNPNRIIGKMFKTVDSHMNPKPKTNLLNNRGELNFAKNETQKDLIAAREKWAAINKQAKSSKPKDVNYNFESPSPTDASTSPAAEFNRLPSQYAKLLKAAEASGDQKKIDAINKRINTLIDTRLKNKR